MLSKEEKEKEMADLLDSLMLVPYLSTSDHFRDDVKKVPWIDWWGKVSVRLRVQEEFRNEWIKLVVKIQQSTWGLGATVKVSHRYWYDGRNVHSGWFLEMVAGSGTSKEEVEQILSKAMRQICKVMTNHI